jgi:tetratricopeptide (TPR) repeat protein
MQYNVALAYFQLNRLNEARAPLSRAAERWPDVFPIAALYGVVLAKLGDDAGAYRALGRAYRLNDKDQATGDLLFLTTLSLGRSAQIGKKYSVAVRYFQEAAKLRPEEPSPHRGLAEVYRLKGNAAAAAAEAKQAARLEKGVEH